MLNVDLQNSKLVFGYMLKKPKYLMQLRKGIFRHEDLEYIALTAKKFYEDYKETPSCEQMKVLLKDNPKEITPDVIDDYYAVDVRSYDDDWLKDTTESMILFQSLVKNLSDSATYLKTTDVTLENVKDVVNRAVDKIENTKLISFDNDLGMDVFDPDNHKSTKEDKIPFTWEYWNKSSDGGLDPKTLHCYIGGTNVGKSIILCNDAADFVRRGKNVLFITCEMSQQKVARRICSNLWNITLEDYDKIVERGKIKNVINEFESRSLIPHGRLWIKEYATGQCTTLDLESYIKEIEEQKKFKVDVLVVDYINIMCNYRNPNSENTYLKIKTLAEDLRGLAVRYNFIVDTATQLGRNGLDSSDIVLTDISESMGLAHTCDSIIGIIQTEDMRIGEIDESTGRAVPYYWFKILKIREGKNKDKKFRVNINYEKMKLIEKTEDVDTMSHFK